MAKKVRCINWEKEEKAILREIMKPYMSVIENKNITTNTNKAKLNAWTEITEQFNRANKRVRDKKQLTNQWKLTKLKSKKELSQYRRQAALTGGGPKPPSPGPETLEILEMIPQEFEVDYNEFDCDATEELVKEIDDKNNNYIHDEAIIVNDNSSVTTIEKGLSTNAPVVIISDQQTQSTSQQTQSTSQQTQSTSLLTPSTSQPTPSTSQPTPSTSQPMLPIRESTTAQVTPKRSARKNVISDKSNFGEKSFEDMHKFRVLENERQQKEHELRLKTMTEMHSQVMINLKIQEQILNKMLDKCNKN